MRYRWCVVCLILGIGGGLEAAIDTIGPPPEVHPEWESRYHALAMPAPIYPYEARRQHLTAKGIIAVDVDPGTGLVRQARMKESTGSAILDQAALSVTKNWRFQPGGSARFEVPVTFDIKGARLGIRAKGLTNRWS